MNRHSAASFLAFAVATLAMPATAQRLGVGGTGVDEASQLPVCEVSMGTVALVEEKQKTDARLDALPPGIRVMMEMANNQKGGGGGSVYPLPLLKLLAARSRCFTVVDRAAGFDAVQRKRAIAAGQSAATVAAPALQVADFVLTASIVYADSKSRQSGGGMGGLIGGIAFTQKTSEAQTLLSLTSVKTGIQEAVASGQARKKDVGLLFGGLSNLGVGALGGTYASTDMGDPHVRGGLHSAPRRSL
jgi:curli biogenesis system outer membrane secretion channel CsgG